MARRASANIVTPHPIQWKYREHGRPVTGDRPALRVTYSNLCTVWPCREKLVLNAVNGVPSTTSCPMRSQSGASPGSSRIQLCKSAGAGVGLGAESQRKSAPAGALVDSPTLGTKK